MEGHERGMPPTEALLSKEKQFEIAEKFFDLSENVGRVVDRLMKLISMEELDKDTELLSASLNIRRTVFKSACDNVNISEQARTWAIKGEVSENA